MKYTVHIYATIRQPITVDAESQLEAIEKAEELAVLSERFGADGFADSLVSSYLVDELDAEGNPEYDRSMGYDCDKTPQL